MAPPKISIKAKMRPKEKITPKPKPVCTPVNVTDDNETHSPPPRAFPPTNVPKSDHPPTTALEDLPMEAACSTDGDVKMTSPGMDSPANAFRLVRPSTPPQTDVAMEIAHAASPAMVPLQVVHFPDLSGTSMPTAIEHSTASESQALPSPSPLQSEVICNEAASADLDVPDRRLEEPTTDPPPAPRTPASKLPLVKKVRLTTATDRVTRRTSQRQREKQAEMSSQGMFVV
jgi:hypothetical protein